MHITYDVIFFLRTRRVVVGDENDYDFNETETVPFLLMHERKIPHIVATCNKDEFPCLLPARRVLALSESTLAARFPPTSAEHRIQNRN